MIRFITRNIVRSIVVFALFSAFQSPETRSQFSALASRTFASVSQSLPGANKDLAATRKNEHRATVVRVVDGDTIIVKFEGSSQQTRVRLIGVNAPESVSSGPIECYGKKAAAFTTATLLPSTKVILTFDKERLDKYGRTLAYVRTVKGLDVQRTLLQGGFATTMSIKPNTARAIEFKAFEQAARLAKFGLWGACK
jgi:micrococcal nuclease